jgi:hypothetical protein
MKTQEEIEQLANQWSDDYNGGSHRDIAKRSYIAGYTQCQEKYTEEDMQEAMICVIVSDSIKNSKDIEDYIKQINKEII